jgi:hypothetical protein
MPNITGPVTSFDTMKVVTASANAIAPKMKWLYVGVAGNITWEDWNGNTGTTAYAVGYHPVSLKKITAATATDLQSLS